jgi:hypothetical protein
MKPSIREPYRLKQCRQAGYHFCRYTLSEWCFFYFAMKCSGTYGEKVCIYCGWASAFFILSSYLMTGRNAKYAWRGYWCRRVCFAVCIHLTGRHALRSSHVWIRSLIRSLMQGRQSSPANTVSWRCREAEKRSAESFCQKADPQKVGALCRSRPLLIQRTEMT